MAEDNLERRTGNDPANHKLRDIIRSYKEREVALILQGDRHGHYFGKIGETTDDFFAFKATLESPYDGATIREANPVLIESSMHTGPYKEMEIAYHEFAGIHRFEEYRGWTWNNG